jgi:hypothetical protein
MDAGSTGTLMTYLFKGKQYIVVAIGGQQHPAELVAFALDRTKTSPAARQEPGATSEPLAPDSGRNP